MQYIKKLFIKNNSIAKNKEFVVHSEACDPFCRGKKEWAMVDTYYAFDKYNNWIRDVISGKHLGMYMSCDILYIEHLTNGNVYGIREDGLLCDILVKRPDYNRLSSNRIVDGRDIQRVKEYYINIDPSLSRLWHDFYLDCVKKFEMNKRIEIINDNF